MHRPLVRQSKPSLIFVSFSVCCPFPQGSQTYNNKITKTGKRLHYLRDHQRAKGLKKEKTSCRVPVFSKKTAWVINTLLLLSQKTICTKRPTLDELPHILASEQSAVKEKRSLSVANFQYIKKVRKRCQSFWDIKIKIVNLKLA